MMSKFLNEFTEKFANTIPPVFQDLKIEFSQEFKKGLTLALEKLDLVTRQEFDIQSQVLANTRRKLTLLEQKLSELEKGLQS